MEMVGGSFRQMTLARGRSELFYNRLVNWLSQSGRLYIHVSPAFLSRRRSPLSLSLSLSGRIFPLFSWKSISPQYFMISDDENGWKNCRLLRAKSRGRVSALRLPLSFSLPLSLLAFPLRQQQQQQHIDDNAWRYRSDRFARSIFRALSRRIFARNDHERRVVLFSFPTVSRIATRVWKPRCESGDRRKLEIIIKFPYHHEGERKRERDRIRVSIARTSQIEGIIARPPGAVNSSPALRIAFNYSRVRKNVN